MSLCYKAPFKLRYFRQTQLKAGKKFRVLQRRGFSQSEQHPVSGARNLLSFSVIRLLQKSITGNYAEKVRQTENNRHQLIMLFRRHHKNARFLLLQPLFEVLRKLFFCSVGWRENERFVFDALASGTKNWMRAQNQATFNVLMHDCNWGLFD